MSYFGLPPGFTLLSAILTQRYQLQHNEYPHLVFCGLRTMEYS